MNQNRDSSPPPVNTPSHKRILAPHSDLIETGDGLTGVSSRRSNSVRVKSINIFRLSFQPEIHSDPETFSSLMPRSIPLVPPPTGLSDYEEEIQIPISSRLTSCSSSVSSIKSDQVPYVELELEIHSDANQEDYLEEWKKRMEPMDPPEENEEQEEEAAEEEEERLNPYSSLLPGMMQI